MPDKFVGFQCHALVAIALFTAVVLPLEGNTIFIELEQPTVGDGDPVSVTRQVGQYLLRSRKRSLGIDDLFGLSQWIKPVIKGHQVVQYLMFTKELQIT